MVRPKISRSPRPSNRKIKKSPNRSPYSRLGQYKSRKSPNIKSSSSGKSTSQFLLKVSNKDGVQEKRQSFRRDSERGGNRRQHNSSNRIRSSNHNSQRWNSQKNRRSNKERHHSGPPMSGGNRQPLSSMRMRMDDYLPRSRQMLLKQKNKDIEHAVVKARREASTRTKDTFWTKKLLDAEPSHPNRWAHNGFKELYGEELGYSEADYRCEENKSPKHSKDEKSQKTSSNSAQGLLSKRMSSKTSYQRSRRRSNVDDEQECVIISGDKTRQNISPKKSASHRHTKHSTELSGKKKLNNSRMSYSRSPVSSSSGSDSRSYSSSSSSRSSYTSDSSSYSSSFSSSSSDSTRSYNKKKRRSYSRSRSPSTPLRSKYASPLKKSVKLSSQRAYATKAVGNESKGKKHLQSKNSTKAVSPLLTHQNNPKKSINNDYYNSNLLSDEISPLRGPTTRTINTNKKETVPSSKSVSQSTVLSRNKKINIVSKGTMLEKHFRVQLKREHVSNSDTSSDEEDLPTKLTLSERFGKLAQLSSQRQEYEGVRMKIVREGGQDKKVYLECGSSRSPSPIVGRNNDGAAHERWLREHKAEYDEYQQLYGEFRQWDPHRDLPRELPRNWDDINIRYRYYKESGYFGDRTVTMDDYLKWEEWWYKYRDWLEKYGSADVEKLRGSSYDLPRVSTHTRSRRSRRTKEDSKRSCYQ